MSEAIYNDIPAEKSKRTVLRNRIFVVALLVAGAWAFFYLAHEIAEDELRAFDESILLALRVKGDLSDPVGPLWVEESARDITALGSFALLGLFSGATAIFLWLSGKHRAFLFIVTSTITGVALSSFLKQYFDRARPDLVPHEMHTLTMSFPSGHAMLSAIIYLSAGALVASTQPRIFVKVFLITLAIVVTVLVGLSRLYLGVHWPTDVIGGWLAGATWALGWWTIALLYLPRKEKERFALEESETSDA